MDCFQVSVSTCVCGGGGLVRDNGYVSIWTICASFIFHCSLTFHIPQTFLNPKPLHLSARQAEILSECIVVRVPLGGDFCSLGSFLHGLVILQNSAEITVTWGPASYSLLY